MNESTFVEAKGSLEIQEIQELSDFSGDSYVVVDGAAYEMNFGVAG